MDKLLAQGWLEETPAAAPADARRVYYAPTSNGAHSLARLGVTIPASKPSKPAAFSCLDWTERRWHLGGPLGRSIVDALAEAGWIQRVPGSRVLELADEPGEFLWLDAAMALR